MISKKKIKNAAGCILPSRLHFCLSQHNSFGASLLLRLKAALYGFSADEWVIYELDKKDRHDYITEYDRHLFREKALLYRPLFDNKMLFYRTVSQIAPVNRVFAYKSGGRYTAEAEGYGPEEIPDRLKSDGILVYKPILDGGGGRGFALLQYEEGCYKISRRPVSRDEIERLLGETDEYMIEEYCRQSDFENLIFPDTVNTLRIITVEDGGDYKVVAVMQRMGAIKGACADNASLGGLFCEVDIQTGRMGAAFSYSPELLFDRNGKKQVFTCHPTTGRQLEGLVIPNFEHIKEEACRIHSELRYTRAKFVGWDFALTVDGYRVVEGNTSSGMKFIQFHQGKRNKEIGQWMRKNGMIR